MHDLSFHIPSINASTFQQVVRPYLGTFTLQLQLSRLVPSFHLQRDWSLKMDYEKLHLLVYHVSLIILNSLSFLLNLLIVTILICYRKKFFPKQRRLRVMRTHNKCLLSLAIADLLVGFFGTLTGILLKFVKNNLIFKLCGLIPLYGSMFISVFSLILLTIDRLVAVKCPFSYDSFMANSRVTTSIVFCWIIPLLTTISQMIIYVMYGLRLELKIRNAILSVVSLSGFVVLMISNFILIRRVKKQRQMSAKLKGAKVFGTVFPVSSDKHSGSPVTGSCASISSAMEIPNAWYPKGETVSSNENLYQRSLTSAFVINCDRLRTFNAQQLKSHSSSPLCVERCPAENLVNIPTCQKNKNEVIEVLADIKEHPQQTLDASNKVKVSVQTSFNSSGGTDRPKLSNRSVPDNKITTMCICIIVVFLMCWLPLVGYRFSYVVGRTTKVVWYQRLTQCLAIANSLFNPFIYFLVRKDFRELLKKLLGIGKEKSWVVFAVQSLILFWELQW